MDYYKITIQITPFEEWLRDVLSSELAETGFDSFIETENGMEAYVSVPNFRDNDLNFVLKKFREGFGFNIEKELIKSRNWNEEWEKNYFEPLVIKNECVIRAPFHTQFPNAKYEIVIEPKMSFGTAHHETTALMIEHLLETEVAGLNVLDMGCGTGVLAILASRRHASAITAIDNDEWAYNNTNENILKNNTTNISVYQGDAALLNDLDFDVILANINRNILLADMEAYRKCMKSGGILMLSGFYLVDLPMISARAAELGLEYKGHKERNNWVAARYEIPRR